MLWRPVEVNGKVSAELHHRSLEAVEFVVRPFGRRSVHDHPRPSREFISICSVGHSHGLLKVRG